MFKSFRMFPINTKSMTLTPKRIRDYSEGKYEWLWPRNTDLCYPKFYDVFIVTEQKSHKSVCFSNTLVEILSTCLQQSGKISEICLKC